MKFVFTLCIAIMAMLYESSETQAQSISFAKNSPLIAAGSISGSGPFDCGAGNVLHHVTLIVTGPIGKNNIATTKADFQMKKPTQTGTWAVAIPNLPAGNYNVSVQLYYTDACNNVIKLNPINAANNPYTVP